ncbi:MAG: protease modulator HflC [Rhodospirillales bacterium]|nr:protease modulator HflC [Rhodospirillales bacterium]
MHGRFPLIAGIVIALLGILIYISTFIVTQTQQAVVLQFGDIKDKVQEPGLHLKLPWQSVRYLDNRVLNLDPAEPTTVLLEDNRRLVVDAFVRYKIVEPEQFIRSVNSEMNLDRLLTAVVDEAVRAVFGEATLQEVVSTKRARLMNDISQRVGGDSTRFGIDIVDLRIGRADLAPDVAEAVYQRMRAERERLAADFRARGEEQYRTITAQADREATVIRAEAQRQADILRGEGEGQRTKILNDAYTKDPEFFGFFRTMEAYRNAMDADNTSMVLTTDSEFFEFFNQAAPLSVPATVNGNNDIPAPAAGTN